MTYDLASYLALLADTLGGRSFGVGMPVNIG